jgi:branched-chain amino acid transport system substrate-binding protein
MNINTIKKDEEDSEMGKRLLTMIFISVLVLFSSTVFAEDGVTNNQVVVGMSTVLSGPASLLGTSFKTGTEAYLKKINDAGGVNGRKIKIIVYDDGYEPSKAVPNANKLIKEDKVFSLLGNVGTPTAMAIKPIITKEEVPFFGPFTGAEPLRNPVVKHILNYRASYYQETEEFIKGMVDVLGLKKVGVFYQDDAYGRVVLEGTKIALKKRGLDPVITSTYQRNTEDIEAGLNAIMKEKPEVVVMVGTYGACAKFIIEGKKKGFKPVYMNVSFVGPDKMLEILGSNGEGVVVTQVVPPPTSDFPAVKEYRASLEKYFPGSKPDFVSLEGYLATKVFVEILKSSGKDLTRESFISAAEGIKNLDIGVGSKISFSAQNHQGSQKVYPTVIKNGKYQIIDDWKSLK